MRFYAFECVQTSTVHCSLHCLVTHVGNLLSLELPLNYSTRAASFPHLFSLQPAPHAPKASSAAQHAGHRQLSQSLCISISSVSRTVCRSQSCDKFQLLPLLVSAACVLFEKKSKNPVPTKTQSLDCGVCCVVYIFPVHQEFGRSKKALVSPTIIGFAPPPFFLITPFKKG